MAYIFGISFGKTQLIELSPKKTWEGFIGGSVSTLIAAFLVFFIYQECLDIELYTKQQFISLS